MQNRCFLNLAWNTCNAPARRSPPERSRPTNLGIPLTPLVPYQFCENLENPVHEKYHIPTLNSKQISSNGRIMTTY